MEQKTKPPIGIEPRWLHERNRTEEIIEAIKRYSLSKEPIPFDWIVELEELMKGKGLI